jgi:hypothetical protein
VSRLLDPLILGRFPIDTNIDVLERNNCLDLQEEETLLWRIQVASVLAKE